MDQEAGDCWHHPVTLMGYYNWTPGVAANSEDLNLVSSQAIAAAHTGRTARARGLPETALRHSSRTGASNPAGRMAMAEGSLRRLFSRVVDDH